MVPARDAERERDEGGKRDEEEMRWLFGGNIDLCTPRMGVEELGIKG